MSSWHRALPLTREVTAASCDSPASSSRFSRAFSATRLFCEEEEEGAGVVTRLAVPAVPQVPPPCPYLVPAQPQQAGDKVAVPAWHGGLGWRGAGRGARGMLQTLFPGAVS